MTSLSPLPKYAGAGVDSGQVLRILLAEDTQINAHALMAMADRFAVEMDVVSNGLDAVEAIETAQVQGNPYTLFLTDIMMPVLDGVETTKRLRELGYGPEVLPIVAITAAASFDEVRSYRAAGVQAFLAKPVSLKEFASTLEAWGHTAQVRKTARQAGAMRELRKQFHDRNLHTLQAIAGVLAMPEIDKDAVDAIRNLLHQIAGTATTFGDPQLSRVARFHENALLEPEAETHQVRELLELARADLEERIS